MENLIGDILFWLWLNCALFYLGYKIWMKVYGMYTPVLEPEPKSKKKGKKSNG